MRAHKASNSPRDLYNLSQLYRVAGNREQSRNCLNELIKADRTNIYYLVSAVEGGLLPVLNAASSTITLP